MAKKQHQEEKNPKKSAKTLNETRVYYQLKPSSDLQALPKIEGFDFDKKQSLADFLNQFATMGLQASELSRAIDVTKMMIRENVPIYLSFTSNMISSGVRETITWLTKNKKVAVLCTSAGGFEEDILKCFKPFRLGAFSASGQSLFDSGVGRIGNIFTTNEHYAYLELFLQPVFEELSSLKRPIAPSFLAYTIGKHLEKNEQLDHTKSYLYWAYKNNIHVYCPGIVDGAIGDMLYFWKQKHPEFVIDVLGDHKQIIDYTLQQERTGAIILGGGISKHYVLNANIFKEGLDYTVYISTAHGYDGSDSGGNQEEAISWAKIKVHSPRVKVVCDASIAFPILAYGAFGHK